MKKGFTLVELLAVIVILAIISIIAIPIVIDMINNSKEKSNKEGLNLYIDTVSKRIASSNLDVLYNPDICTIQSTGDLLCLKNDEELYVDDEKTNKILEIKMNGKKPSEGTLYFTDGKITTGENIKYNDLYYTITNGVVSKGSKEKTDIITGVVERIKNSVGNISGTCEIQNATTMICNGETKQLIQSGHKVTEGVILFNNGEITSYRNIKMDGKYYHNKNGKKSETDEKQYLCTKVNDSDSSGTVTKGDKYTCEVKKDTNYTFYVLTDPADGQVNLIMDRNICNDGTVNYTSENNYCRYKWYTSNNNTYGPVTVMAELYAGTKDWDNVSDMIMNYRDENNEAATDMGYTSIITSNGVTTITGKPESNTTTLGTSAKPLKARLPKYSEINEAGCTGSNGACPVWLMENMKYYNVANDKYSINNNDEAYQNIGGYWLLSSTLGSSTGVRYAGSNGHMGANSGTGLSSLGARPVITAPIDDLSN